MSSTRSIAVVLLLCAVSLAGCKKKGTAAGGDAEPAGSAAPAESTGAAAPSGGEGGATGDGAAAASDEGGGQAAATDEGGIASLDAALVPAPTGPTGPTGGGGGNGFTGNYSCMGGLTLTQTGNGVRGSAITRNGNTVTNYDFTCTVIGNECKGNASKFISKEGRGPKSAGGSRVTFRLANGGLNYTEGGSSGFCTRK